jgi:hypothetical protein
MTYPILKLGGKESNFFEASRRIPKNGDTIWIKMFLLTINSKRKVACLKFEMEYQNTFQCIATQAIIIGSLANEKNVFQKPSTTNLLKSELLKYFVLHLLSLF